MRRSLQGQGELFSPSPLTPDEVAGTKFPQSRGCPICGKRWSHKHVFGPDLSTPRPLSETPDGKSRIGSREQKAKAGSCNTLPSATGGTLPTGRTETISS